jgi:hypothetical protein
MVIAISLSLAVNASGLPNLVPIFLEASIPAITLCRINDFSNSANDAKTGILSSQLD